MVSVLFMQRYREVIENVNHNCCSDWNLLKLFSMHLLAVGLLASYVLPGGFSLWREIDGSIFFWLNGTLSQTGLWEAFWAWSNTRYCDAAVGLFIVLFLVYPVLGLGKDRLQPVFFKWVTMILLLLGARTVFHYLSDWLELGGPGPSLVLSPVVMLSDLYPNVPLKDSSTDSFPGDHATVLLAWTGFVLFQSFRWSSILAALLPLTMILPRLVAGAHWLSDVVVGGLVVVLPILGWTFFSPVVERLSSAIARAVQPLIRTMAGWPWFRSQDFFIFGPQPTGILGIETRNSTTSQGGSRSHPTV